MSPAAFIAACACAVGTLVLTASPALAGPGAPSPTARPANDAGDGAVAINQVATIDTAKAFQDCQETKGLQTELRKRQKAFLAESAKRTKHISELKEKRDAFKSQDPQWSKADEQLRKAGDDYERWLAETRKEVASYQCHLMNDVFKDIETATAAVAAQKGIRLVVANNSEKPPFPDLDNCTVNEMRAALTAKNIIYTDPRLKLPALDITADVVAWLDAPDNDKPGAKGQ